MAGRNVLNVAEKPSVASSISGILSSGNARKRDGFSKFNACFDFSYNIGGTQCNMTMTSVAGHLTELCFPDHISGNWKIDPVELFSAPVEKKIEKHKNIEKTLHREAKKCQWLILWTDCDREGENIACEIVDTCRKVNPRLQVFRAHFAALIAADIHRACKMENLTPPNKRDSDAVDTRTEVDLRIGFAFTRFQTIRFRRFSLPTKDVVSYGPCQFPTLGFVVDRYWKRKAFKPENFWNIALTLEKNREKSDFIWNRGRLYDRISCIALYEVCMENPIATIVSVEEKETRKYRPFPLTTVELQRRAAKSLKITAHTAMNIAETLYMDGFISYPRTETDQFPKGFDFKQHIEHQAGHQLWGEYAQRLLGGGFRMPKAGKNNDQSHPPIYPVRAAPNLQGHAKQLYEFIVRHYLACCSDDAKGAETKVVAQVAGEHFTATGLAIKERNFLEIYPYLKWSDKTVASFSKGERLQPASLMMHEGTTSPPPLLTEADLIKLMDDNGIGTDATIAEHIHKIQKRNYIVPIGGFFEPTPLGEALVAGYNFIGFRKLNQPQLRAFMESEMKQISAGTKTKDEVIRQSVDMYKSIFVEVAREASKLDKALGRYFPPASESFSKEKRNFSLCGKCQSMMSYRVSDNGESFLHCPTCQESYQLPRGNPVKASHICPLCSFDVLTITTPNKKTINACPHCYSNPPDIENAADGLQTGAPKTMPCFACAANCTMAGKRGAAVPVRDCPCCGSPMNLKQKKDGTGAFVSCSKFPDCKKSLFLPPFGVDFSAVSTSRNECSNCPGTHLLEFATTQKAQFEGMPAFVYLCVRGCDPGSLHLIEAANRNFALWETSVPPPSNASSSSAPSNTRINATTRPGNSSSKFSASRQPGYLPHQDDFDDNDVGGGGGGYPSGGSSYGGGNDYDDDDSGGGGFRGSGYSNNRQSNYDGSAYGGGDGSYQKRGSNQNSNNNFGRGSSASGGGGGGRQSITLNAQGEAICACGNTAVQRTSKKENENKGRQFYTCADGSCNAFSWADSVGEDTGGGENWGGGGGGGYNKGGGYQKKKSYSNKSFGPGASAGGHKKGKYGDNNNSSSAAPKVQRKCGVCGQPGHNKKNCPNS